MNNSTMDEQSGDLGASDKSDRATREPSLRLGHTASVPSADELRLLSDRIAQTEYRSACAGLSSLEGCRVTFDGEDFRFWKWGNEFFCASPQNVFNALRELAQAIEAGTGETGTGSTEGESAVGNADAPNNNPGGIGD